jgi:hypothetical protein
MKYGYVNGTKYRPQEVHPWRNTKKKVQVFSNFEYINPYPEEKDKKTDKTEKLQANGVQFDESNVEGVQSKPFCSVNPKGVKTFSSTPYVCSDYDEGTQAIRV